MGAGTIVPFGKGFVNSPLAAVLSELGFASGVAATFPDPDGLAATGVAFFGPHPPKNAAVSNKAVSFFIRNPYDLRSDGRRSFVNRPIQAFPIGESDILERCILELAVLEKRFLVFAQLASSVHAIC